MCIKEINTEPPLFTTRRPALRGALPQALPVRGKSTSRHTAAAPAGRLTVGDAGAPSPGIIVPGLRSPAQVVNMYL